MEISRVWKWVLWACMVLFVGCGVVQCSVTFDIKAMVIDGQRRILISGSIHYPRSTLEVESGIMCESCNGRGWLLCDFCKGQKTNVRLENNRIYRRCPSCRAVGSILCSKCKVYKCVTFPDQNDGDELNF